MKLASAGEINQDFITIFQANCRLPHINMRDVESMKGALGVGRQRVLETVDQYGIEAFMASHEALKDYAATKVREVLRRLPDGTYSIVGPDLFCADPTLSICGPNCTQTDADCRAVCEREQRSVHSCGAAAASPIYQPYQQPPSKSPSGTRVQFSSAPHTV